MQRTQLQVGNPLYGQLVIGPPGSGKSTYCQEALKFYKNLGRKIGVINLDPGNENIEYTTVIDVKHLITVEDAMNEFNFGPNGSLMFCMEYLEQHLEDWFVPELKKAASAYNYFIFDCPGQVELYTHHSSMANIFRRLENENYHLVTLNLIDSHYCSDPFKFISALMLSLNMMFRMGLPHLNVLSKADLLRENSTKLHFNLDFYTDVLDLNYLLEVMGDSNTMNKKFNKINAAICAMIEDYGLVSFELLETHNSQSMMRLRNNIDKANGYIYNAGEESSINTLVACAVGAQSETCRHANDIDPYINS